MKITLLLFTSVFCGQLFAQDSLYSKVIHNDDGYRAYDIAYDGNSHLVQVGVTNYSYASFAKLDSLGNVLDSKQYQIDGQPANNFAFKSIITLSDGNYLAAGTVMLQNFGVNVGVVVKLDNSGNILWNKGVFPVAPIYFECNAVLETSDNMLWVVGSDSQSGEMVISRLDSDGSTVDVWSYKNAGLRFKLNDLKETDNQEIIFSGYALDNSSMPEAIVFATDLDGVQLWTNSLSGYYFYEIVTADNSIRLATYSTNNKIGLLTVSNTGDLVNVTESSNSSVNYPEEVSMALLKDSTYVISHNDGFSSHVFTIAPENPVITDHQYMTKIATVISRENKGVYLSGNGPIYGIKSASSWYAQPHNSLARLDSTLLDQSCSWGDAPQIASETTLSNDAITFTSVSDASVMDLAMLVMPMELQDSVSCVDFYSAIDEMNEDNFSIYPNPATEQFTLKMNKEISGSVVIYDLNGKVVFERKFTPGNSTFNISQLNKGFYVYSVFNKNSEVVKSEKLVVE